MTNEKKAPNGIYRQMFYQDRRDKPYTTGQFSLSDYLASEIWRNLRIKRLQIDGYKCQICGSAINTQVHHIRYPDVWGMEPIDDLVTLCDHCHEKVHENDRRN